MDVDEIAQRIRNRVSWTTSLDEMTLFKIKEAVKEILEEAWEDLYDSYPEYDDEE